MLGKNGTKSTTTSSVTHTNNTEELGLLTDDRGNIPGDINNAVAGPFERSVGIIKPEFTLEYGEPWHHNLCAYTLLASNFDNNYDYYVNVNDSASCVTSTSGVKDDALVSIASELPTNSTIERHDAHAPEHGEPYELRTSNSTTCHKSANYTPTRRVHQRWLDGFLSYSTSCNVNNDGDPLAMPLDSMDNVSTIPCHNEHPSSTYMNNNGDNYIDNVMRMSTYKNNRFSSCVSLVTMSGEYDTIIRLNNNNNYNSHIDIGAPEHTMIDISAPGRGIAGIDIFGGFGWNVNNTTMSATKHGRNYSRNTIGNSNVNLFAWPISNSTEDGMNYAAWSPFGTNLMNGTVFNMDSIGYEITTINKMDSDDTIDKITTEINANAHVGGNNHNNLLTYDGPRQDDVRSNTGSTNNMQLVTSSTNYPMSCIGHDMLRTDYDHVNIEYSSDYTQQQNVITCIDNNVTSTDSVAIRTEHVGTYNTVPTKYVLVCKVLSDDHTPHIVSDYVTADCALLSDIQSYRNDNKSNTRDGKCINGSRVNNVDDSTEDGIDFTNNHPDNPTTDDNGKIVNTIKTNHNISIQSSTIDTNNTHMDARYEVLAYTGTPDDGEANTNHAYASTFDYHNTINVTSTRTINDCMHNDIDNRLSSSIAIVTDQCDWKLNHEIGFTNDISLLDNELETCYLFQLTICYMPIIQTMKRRLEQFGSSRKCNIWTTHGEQESIAYHSARGLGTIIESWMEHVCIQLIIWMTKAYRRGVTCTEEVRICLVSFLYPYLLGSHLLSGKLDRTT